MEKLKMETTKYDIFTMKSEEMKFNAFFSYLRSFSEAGLDTLQKLESEFHKEMKKNKNEKQTLSIMKNILSSYEIFVLEIKDSCDFVEIPEFGFCISKTFSQMLKIVKWFLRTWLKNTQKYLQIKEKLKDEEKKNVEESEELTICAFCEELIRHNPYTKDSRAKRKGVAIADMNSDFRTVKKNHLQEKSHLMEFQQQVLQRYTLKQISSKRYISDPGEVDILNRKYAIMKLQFSNGGNVLQEVLNEFNLKTEAIARFVNNSQIVGLEDYKMSNQIDYEHFQKEMKVRIEAKLEQAREKLKALQRIKQSKMAHKNIQTELHEVTEKQKNQLKIKSLMQAMKKLKSELESQKALNQSFKKLLEAKSVEFEEEFLNYRKEVIRNLEPRSKTMLKSLKDIRDFIEAEDGQEDKENGSINDLEQGSKERMTNTVRIGGLARDKDKHKKNHSIRFTLQDESHPDENDRRSPTIESNLFQDSCNTDRICVNTVATQTEEPSHILAGSNATEQKFFLVQRDKESMHSSRKILRQKKYQSQLKKRTKGPQQLLKQPHPNLYAHVKSKVFNRVESTATLRKEPRSKFESINLVQKLSMNHSLAHCQSLQSQPIQCFKISAQPIFKAVSQLSFTIEDVYNLYLNLKNAQNYQCLLYRNSIFNNSNLNPKRAINNHHKIYASDMDWSFKKDFELSESVEHKLTHSIFHQLCNIKRRQKTQYHQIKIMLRCPSDIGSDVQLLSLEGHQEQSSKDIELTELRKMMNIILRFHGECVSCQKDTICNHLVQFCQKIGIRIC